MTRKSLQIVAAGGLVLGGAGLTLWADDLANLPAFKQPVQLSGQIEPIDTTPAAAATAAAEPRRLFPKLREHFGSFPKQREVSGKGVVKPVAAQIEVPPQQPPLEPSMNPGHSLGPDLPNSIFPPPPSVDDVFRGEALPADPVPPGAGGLPLEHSLNPMQPAPGLSLFSPAPVNCDEVQTELVPSMPQPVERVSPSTTRISTKESLWKRLVGPK